MYSQKDGPQLGLEYRRRFDEGYMQFDGSFTHANLIDEIGVNKGQQWRGHLFGSAVYNLSNQWRTGSDIAFASDKSYFGRYAITSQDQLSNRVYAEGFKGRDYTVVNSYLFDDLRAGKQVLQPLVLPQSSFSMFGEPGKTWGGRWSLGGSELVTTRDNANEPLWQQGPNTRHVSLNGGWERKLISDYGMETTISGLLRGDAYSADNVQDQRNPGVVYNHVLLGRQFEQANAVMSYPFVRNGDGYQHMISPIVAVTAAPNVHMSAKQPIEDSLDVQFDETNLFSPNRFTGTDLIEGGNRATYGMRQSVVTDSGGRLELFGGQSFSTSHNMGFSDISGLNNHSSDYVGRFDFVPVDWFSLNYGLRLNYSDYKPQSQDANIMIGPPIFRASMRYINAYQTDTTGTLDKVHEITGRISSNFMKYYTFTAAHTQAFTPDPGPRGTSATLNYADECFIYGVTANRTDTSRADLSSGFSVVFHIFLKNLGGAHTDSYSSPQFNTQFRQTE